MYLDKVNAALNTVEIGYQETNLYATWNEITYLTDQLDPDSPTLALEVLNVIYRELREFVVPDPLDPNLLKYVDASIQYVREFTFIHAIDKAFA